MRQFNFHLPVNVLFGEGRVRDLRNTLPPGTQRILIVTDGIVAEKSGALEAILPQLSGCEVSLFSEVEENPSFVTLEKGRRLAREEDSQVILGLGGGSPMDAAKGIAVLATNEDDMRDYMGGASLSADPLPVICIPTTSGTGSETTPYAVFTDPENQTKGGYAHPKIFPVASIVDPELTYSMPEEVVVNTGLDALTHAIESYLSSDAFPMCDIFALETVRVVLDALPDAARHDREAMCRMAYASMLAGVAITHGGTILLHIMGYPLTVFHGIAHGKANAILLPEFMRFMRESSTVPDRVRTLDGLFEGVGGIQSFVEELGVSTKLSSYGIREEELGLFSKKVIVKGDVQITPAELTEEIITDLFRSAL